MIILCSIPYPDIMYLNRQRVQALEELDKMKKEQKALLEKIQQLEDQPHASSEQGNKTVKRF